MAARPNRFHRRCRGRAQLGTVAPAYRVGDTLSPGIQVTGHIPTDTLSKAGSAALDQRDPCRSIPPAVVAPAGFPDKPVGTSKLGCDWVDYARFALRIGDFPRRDMAREVAEHVDLATGRGSDTLSHLAWLLIDGHYAIERILKSDDASSCWLSVDLGSPSIAFVVILAVDVARQAAAVTSPGDSVSTFCPKGRTIAQNLLRHLLGPLGPIGFPTR